MWYHWVIFSFILVAVPFGMVAWYIMVKQKNKELKFNLKQTAKVVGFWWLLDLLYMASFNGWLVWQFIFGCLALVMVFYNLCIAFLANNEVKLRFLLLIDFIVGIAITIYLIYIIPNSNLQSIVTTVIAAVYGGLLTLVGVAWTIKKGDKDRKEDERKKYFPYIKLVDKDNFDSTVIAGVYGTVDLDDEKNSKERDVYYRYDICKFSIKNIADSIIVLYGIELNGKFLAFTESKVLEKNDCCQISTTGVFCCESWEPFNDISLIVKDILGNKYRVKCNTEKRSRWGKTDTPNKDGKLFDYEQSGIKIKTISLPELMQEGK